MYRHKHCYTDKIVNQYPRERDSWEIYSKYNKRGVKETDTSILEYKVYPTEELNKYFNKRKFRIDC